VVVVMSPAASASRWVAEEISFAERRQKPLLPLVLDGEPLFGMRRVHYERVAGGRMPSEAFVARLRELTSADRRDRAPGAGGPLEREGGATWPVRRHRRRAVVAVAITALTVTALIAGAGWLVGRGGHAQAAPSPSPASSSSGPAPSASATRPTTTPPSASHRRSPAATASPRPAFALGSDVHLQNVSTHDCLSGAYGLYIQACDASDADIWTLRPTGGDTFELVNRSSDNCVGSQAVKDSLAVYGSCASTGSVQWRVAATTSVGQTLRNTESGYCLEISPLYSPFLQLTTCNSSDPTQLWRNSGA
jgi:hypothetical protein